MAFRPLSVGVSQEDEALWVHALDAGFCLLRRWARAAAGGGRALAEPPPGRTAARSCRAASLSEAWPGRFVGTGGVAGAAAVAGAFLLRAWRVLCAARCCPPAPARGAGGRRLRAAGGAGKRTALLPPAGRRSQNHRMFGAGRDLCGSASPSPPPKQGHLQQAAQDHVPAGLRRSRWR